MIQVWLYAKEMYSDAFVDLLRYAAEAAEEARMEEYEMHKAIVGKDRADEDFFFHPNDGD